ncbi:inverse autotransporter beta domain-containing protein [Aeromonas veronii]|uniref:inverse autotransporter beta domain-containing protein n=1 Tax=Aeromonas sp. R9-2 TaxID=3138479 RepID=UPI0034A480F0
MRLKAYLPSYPQLGANAAFELYYGEEVALAGTSERAVNPSAFSYGLEYTPFSLLTFGVGQKHWGSTHDTSVSMDLNLRLVWVYRFPSNFMEPVLVSRAP